MNRNTNKKERKMTKKRAKFAAKRLRYRMKVAHMYVQQLEAANKLLQDEIVELSTSDFNHIFHMSDQKRGIPQ